MLLLCLFFKQKTAYEMRISDWSSDVCSSDLEDHHIVDELVEALHQHKIAQLRAVAEEGLAVYQGLTAHGEDQLVVVFDPAPWPGADGGAAFPGVGEGLVFDGVHGATCARDRKSTRLNSSH